MQLAAALARGRKPRRALPCCRTHGPGTRAGARADQAYGRRPTGMARRAASGGRKSHMPERMPPAAAGAARARTPARPRGAAGHTPRRRRRTVVGSRRRQAAPTYTRLSGKSQRDTTGRPKSAAAYGRPIGGTYEGPYEIGRHRRPASSAATPAEMRCNAQIIEQQQEAMSRADDGGAGAQKRRVDSVEQRAGKAAQGNRRSRSRRRALLSWLTCCAGRWRMAVRAATSTRTARSIRRPRRPWPRRCSCRSTGEAAGAAATAVTATAAARRGAARRAQQPARARSARDRLQTAAEEHTAAPAPSCSCSPHGQSSRAARLGAEARSLAPPAQLRRCTG